MSLYVPYYRPYNKHNTNIHASGGIRTRNPSKRAAVDPRLRPRGHWDRLTHYLRTCVYIQCAEVLYLLAFVSRPLPTSLLPEKHQKSMYQLRYQTACQIYRITVLVDFLKFLQNYGTLHKDRPGPFLSTYLST
jgi:hypothetical protein